MEKISPKIVKDIEKYWFQSRSRDFCQFLEGFSIGFEEFGKCKKTQHTLYNIKDILAHI